MSDDDLHLTDDSPPKEFTGGGGTGGGADIGGDVPGAGDHPEGGSPASGGGTPPADITGGTSAGPLGEGAGEVD